MFFKITRFHTWLNKNKRKIWINVKVFKIILKVVLFEKYVFPFSVNWILLYLLLFENKEKKHWNEDNIRNDVITLRSIHSLLNTSRMKILYRDILPNYLSKFHKYGSYNFFSKRTSTFGSPPFPCLHLSTFAWPSSPLSCRHPLWMAPLVKKDLNILVDTKMLKKLNLYVYFSQKWVHIEKTLMEQNVCLFW